MRSDGKTSPLSCEVAETASPDCSKKGSVVGPHKTGSDVETTVETATRGLLG